MYEFWRTACQRQIVKNALIIAFVVGTALNAVNQGREIWINTGISWSHIILNYLVPYCVATYSAARNELSRNRDV